MAGLMRVPRTRGALSGLILMVLGAWGALVPFIGPYFDFALTPRPNDTWYYTNDRLWLSILPGAAAFIGGFIVMTSANRAMAMLGGWLAAIAGAWFIVGPNLSPLTGSMPDPGSTTGGTTRAVLEVLLFYFALGAVIIFLAALALGRFLVVGVREIRQAEARAAEEREATATTTGPATAATAGMAGTTAAGAPAAGTTADGTMADETTGRTDRTGWSEPKTATGGRHEAPAAGTSADVPPMAPPAEGEKVGAGAGAGRDHHRRIFHRRHHDDT